LLRTPRGRPSIWSRLRKRTGLASRGSFCKPTRASSRCSSLDLGSTSCFFSAARRSAYRATTSARCLLRAILLFLAICLSLLAEFYVLANHRIVLLQHEAVWIVAAILTGDIGVPGAGG